MPRRVAPLPSHLASVFSGKDVAIAAIPWQRLQRSDVSRVSFGVYKQIVSEASATQGDPNTKDLGFVGKKLLWHEKQLELAAVLGPHLPDHHFFSHRTAAALWGLPTFRDLNPNLDVACFRPTRPLRREGFNATNVSPILASSTTHSGFGARLTDPASTWAMQAAALPLPDLVALGDAIIRRHRWPGSNTIKQQPLARLADLEHVVRAGRRLGINRLREALPLLSTSSASVPESHLRLELGQWGLLPYCELDYDVFDKNGRFLGSSEFAFPEFKLAVEYEGAHHLTSAAQWNRDIEKYRSYTQAGWEVIQVTAELLYRSPWQLRAHILEALGRRGWSV